MNWHILYLTIIVTRYGAFVGAGCPFGNGRFVENATAMSAILFSLAF